MKNRLQNSVKPKNVFIIQDGSKWRPSWIEPNFQPFTLIFQLGTILQMICHNKYLLYAKFDENVTKTTYPKLKTT